MQESQEGFINYDDQAAAAKSGRHADSDDSDDDFTFKGHKTK